MPDGSNTVVDEQGYRLSRGGEKQRVAIAQVLLKDPRVIILDEATSHPDSQPEAAIQNAMEAAPLGRTSLVIAHRLSTVIDADCILVRDQRRLVEQGRHEDLLALVERDRSPSDPSPHYVAEQLLKPGILESAP